MTRYRHILNVIATIRDSHPEMVNIFKYGSCMNFHLILRSVFPEAEPYFNIDHVITRIGNRYYDITGSVNPSGYRPYHTFYNKRRTSRSFTQMAINAAYDFEQKQVSDGMS